MRGGDKLFFNTYPLFNRGRILKLEMLEQLRDFPRDFIDIVLEQYSDGIIAGCNLKVEGNRIIISKGVIKHDNLLYLLKEDYSLSYKSTNHMAMLKIKFLGETKNNDFVNYGTEIFIDNNLNLKEDEMELGRFKLKIGARLRADYINLEDMYTEYDTINIINVPFAAFEKSSLCPYILNCFAKEAFKYKLVNALDISFCMLCLQNQQVMERELILNYIKARLEIEEKEYSNEQIYEHLVRILQGIRRGKEDLENNKRTDYKKIIVD